MIIPLTNVDKKIVRNRVFDCNQKHCFWRFFYQCLSIFDPRLSIVKSALIAAYPVWYGSDLNKDIKGNSYYY